MLGADGETGSIVGAAASVRLPALELMMAFGATMTAPLHAEAAALVLFGPHAPATPLVTLAGQGGAVAFGAKERLATLRALAALQEKAEAAPAEGTEGAGQRFQSPGGVLVVAAGETAADKMDAAHGSSERDAAAAAGLAELAGLGRAAVAAQVVSDDRLGLMPREALLAFAQQMRLVVTSTRDVEAAGKGAAPQGGAAVRSATRAAEPTVKRDKLL